MNFYLQFTQNTDKFKYVHIIDILKTENNTCYSTHITTKRRLILGKQ